MMFLQSFHDAQNEHQSESPCQNDTFQRFDASVNTLVCARSRMNVCAKMLITQTSTVDVFSRVLFQCVLVSFLG